MIALALSLLLVIAVHEVAHALAAMRVGVPVRRVIIGAGLRWTAVRLQVRGVPVELRPLPVGGLCDVDEHAASPRGLVLVSLAGPAANLALGLLALAASHGAEGLAAAAGIAGAAPRMVASLLVSAVLWVPPPSVPLWLPADLGLLGGAGVLSMVVGLGNLLPLPPLDGGQAALNALAAAGIPVPRRWAYGLGAAALAALHLPLLVGRAPRWQVLAAIAAGLAAGEFLTRRGGGARRKGVIRDAVQDGAG